MAILIFNLKVRIQLKIIVFVLVFNNCPEYTILIFSLGMELFETHMGLIFPCSNILLSLAFYNHIQTLPAQLEFRNIFRWLLFPSYYWT